MSEKKLVLLITEGGSDAAALSVPLRRYFLEKQIARTFECVIYGTDISLHARKDPPLQSDPALVMERVVEAIEEFLGSQTNSNKYTLDDIGVVMTLSDLDCCYCREPDLEFGGPHCATYPDYQRKRLICNDVAFVSKRNEIKTDALGVLRNEEMIKLRDGKVVPFRAFYCSVNLEHSLYNDTLSRKPEEKMALAKQWASKYKQNANEFYLAVSSIPRLGDGYLESWDERELRKNPFSRLSNLKIMIDWLTVLPPQK